MDINIAEEPSAEMMTETNEPIYKSKDGQIVTHSQLIHSGYDKKSIDEGLSSKVLSVIGNTQDHDQEYKSKDGQIVTTKQLLESGYPQSSIDNGILDGILTPLEKKNQLQAVSTTTSEKLPGGESESTTNIQTVALDKEGKEVPAQQPLVGEPTDAISKVLKIQELKKKGTDVNVPAAGGNLPSTFVPDEASQKQAKSIESELASQKINADELYKQIKDLPEEFYNTTLTKEDGRVEKPYTKENLSKMYMEEPMKFQYILNQSKNRLALQKAAKELTKEGQPTDGVYLSNKYNSLNEAPSFEQWKQNKAEQQNMINTYISSMDDRRKALDRLEETSATFITPNNLDLIKEYEQSPLKDKVDVFQYATLENMKLFHPEKYQQAINFISAPSETEYEKTANVSFGKEGVGIQPTTTETEESVNRKLGRETVLKNIADEGRYNAILDLQRKNEKLVAASIYDTLDKSQVDSIKQQYQDNNAKIQAIKDDYKKDDERYPLTATNKYDQQIKDITQQAGFNAAEYATAKFGQGFIKTGKSLEDVLVGVFGNNQDKVLHDLAGLGEYKQEQSDFYLPNKYNKDNPIVGIKVDKPLQNDLNKILKNRSISDLSQYDKEELQNILSKNQNQIHTITNTDLQGKKANYTASSILYSNAGMIGDILSFSAQAGLLGGLGLSSEVASATTMYTTTKNDFRNEAISDGNPDPDGYANVMATICSLAGFISPKLDVVKRAAGAESKVGQMISGITEKTWDNVIEKNKKIVDRISNSVSHVGKEAATMGLTYGAGVPIAQGVVGKEMYAKPISYDKIFEDALQSSEHLMVSSIGLLGVGALTNLKGTTLDQKANLWQAASNEPLTLAKIDEAVKNRLITPDQATQRKEVIQNASKIINEMPTKNTKGELMTDEQRLNYFYNLLIQNESKNQKEILPKAQQNKAEFNSIIADHLNNLILDPKTPEELNARKKELENSLQSGKLEEKQKLDNQAELEAINIHLEEKQKEQQPVPTPEELLSGKKQPKAEEEKIYEYNGKQYKVKGREVTTIENDLVPVDLVDEILTNGKEVTPAPIEKKEEVSNEIGPKPKPITEESIKESEQWINDLFDNKNGTKIQDKDGNVYEIKDGKLRKLTFDKDGNVIDSEIVYQDKRIHKRGTFANPDFFENGYKILEEAPKAKEEVPAENQKEIDKLRAEEQAELDSRIPNAEQYRVDGKVDRSKLTNEEDIKAFDEVYDKYDKLISPLLKEVEVPKEEEIIPMEKEGEEPPFIQEGGRTIVTHSGLTEEGRQKLIAQRNKELKVTEKSKDEQSILDEIDKYNSLKEGRLGKLKPEGLGRLNKIRAKIAEFNEKHGTDYEFNQKSGRLVNEKFRAIKRRAVEGREAEVNEKGKTIRERDSKTQDVFDDLLEQGTMPTGYREDGLRMSDAQLDATVQDILDGIPSRRANNYLDSLERQIAKDDFDFSKGDDMPAHLRPQIKLEDVLDISKETAGQPMSEADLNKWLETEAERTPENAEVYDNIDNLITDYETRNESEGEVRPAPATPEERVTKPTEQIAEKKEPTGKPKPKEPAKPTTEKVGKFKEKAKKLSDKIRQTELPDWLSIDDKEIKKSGMSADEIKNLLADAVEKMGELLDKGVDFSEAVKQSVKDLVKAYGEEKRDLIEKGFANDYKKKLAEEPRTFGVSQEALKKVAERLGLKEPKPGERLSVPEQTKRGEKLLEAGVDPNEVADDFKKTKNVSADIISISRAHLKNLIEKAEAIKDRNSQEYKDALSEIQKWQDEVMKPMGTEAGATFSALQGEEDLDTGSFTAVEYAYKHATGNSFSPEQAKQAEVLTGKVKELTEQVNKLQKDLTEAINKSVKESGDKTDSKKRFAQRAVEAIDRIQAKIRNKTYSDATGMSALIDMGLTTIKLAIKAGDSVAEAIEKGISQIKEKYQEKYGKKWEKEDEFRKDVTEGFKEEGIHEPSEDKETSSRIKALEKRLADLKEGKVKERKERAEPTEEEQNLLDQIKEEKEKIKLNNLVDSLAGKKDAKFSPDEVKGIWDYAQKAYLDEGASIDEMVRGVATDLGLTTEQVRKAFMQDKEVKRVSDEMYKKMKDKRDAQNKVRRWIEATNTPKAVRFFKAIPGAFFATKTFGHGTVGFITHAGMDIFQPKYWKEYFPAFLKQFKYAFGSTAKYEQAMADLVSDPTFIMWKRAGLAVDPNLTYSEYEGARKYFQKLGEMGDRGFNALKVYRLAKANYEYNKLSNVEKADPKVVEAIAKNVNLSTGSSDVVVPKSFNVAFFAPKLVASQFQRLTSEPASVVSTILKGKSATPAEKVAAKIWSKNAGTMVAMYVSALIANQALGSLFGSKQSVNFNDPSKKDWLKFKIGDKTLDVSAGMIPTINLIGGLLYSSLYGKQKKKEITNALANFAYGKLSPFASTTKDFAFQRTFNGDVMPFSNEKPAPGKKKLTWAEYLGTGIAPIPVAEALHDIMESMKEKGMTKPEVEDVLNGIFMGTVSGFTGAKLRNIPPAINIEDKFPDSKGVQMLKDKGVDMPEVPRVENMKVNVDKEHPDGYMTEKEKADFLKIWQKEIVSNLDDIAEETKKRNLEITEDELKDARAAASKNASEIAHIEMERKHRYKRTMLKRIEQMKVEAIMDAIIQKRSPEGEAEQPEETENKE